MRIAAAQPANAAADATAAGALPTAADGGFAALLAAALPIAGTDAIAATNLAAPPATNALPLPLQAVTDTEDEAPQADAALQALLAGVGLLPRGDAPAVTTDKPADARPLLTEASTALPAAGATASLPSEATALPKAESDTRVAPKTSHASAAVDAAKPNELPATASQTAHTVQAAHASSEPTAKDLQDTPALMNLVGTTAAAPTALHPSQAVMHVAEPMGTHRWEQAFSTQVVWAAREQLQSASLTLNPPELGPVKIELQLSDNQASASFSSPQPEVRKAIEDALPGLKTLFADAGLQLQHANVGSGDARQGQPRPAPFAAARARGRADDGPLPAAEAPQLLSRRLLDTFA